MALVIINIVLFSVTFGLLLHYFTNNFAYWNNKGVKYVKPYPLVGSMLSVFTLREHMLDFFYRIYNNYTGERFVGYFQCRSPVLFVRDPELAKNILVKDFIHFTDHGFKVHEEADPLQAKNLFNMEGQRWKEMRSKLSPTFTSGRMKVMFSLVQECSQRLEDYLKELADSGKQFEAKDLFARYTTDTIASCAFGIKSDALRDPNNEFRNMGRKLIEMDFWRGLKTMFVLFAPEISLRFRLTMMDRELTTYFRTLVRHVIAMRKKTGEIRNDFMQLLIELKEQGKLEDSDDQHVSSLDLTEDDVTAQATVFFLAGFETSSTVLSLALLELAVYPEVQEKARQEIEKVLQKHNGQVTYQALQEMKYLEAIMYESMRKYPPTNALIRVCTKHYVIPDTQVSIEAGTQVLIPIHAIQNDPQYFPEPQRFKPERFLNGHFKNQYIFMPFGEGPRQCIGYRFAKIQSKLGLLSVLRNNRINVAPGTKYPVSLDPKQLVPTPRSKVWISLSPIQKM